MKLILFFLLIGFVTSGSLIFEKISIRKNKKPIITILSSISMNLVILGIGGAWWFFTETDGISQGVGVTIYFISFVVISLLNLICFFFWRNQIKIVKETERKEG